MNTAMAVAIAVTAAPLLITGLNRLVFQDNARYTLFPFTSSSRKSSRISFRQVSHPGRRQDPISEQLPTQCGSASAAGKKESGTTDVAPHLFFVVAERGVTC
ncbi:hypothetical protein ACH4GP_19185 [Streptomyces celluloflavus]|uniref:Secreted protein n=1 Tax=Streptomyces celluloflavus TaxID=58344 RepID=A0ABW7REM2_9ACTN